MGLSPRSLGPLRSLIIGQVWAFLVFAPSLGMLTLAYNRYFWCWSTKVLLLRLGCVVGIGLIGFLVGRLVRWFSPSGYDRLAALAGLGVAGLVFWWGVVSRQDSLAMLAVMTGAILVLAAGLAQISWRRRWMLARWKEWLARASLVLAPVVPLFWITAYNYPRYPAWPVPRIEQAGQVAERPGTSARDNVYLFVFDEWPYRLTFGSDGVLPHMPRLAEAARQMCVFGDAHSPGCHTIMSMPRLLYQRRDFFALQGGRVGFWDGEFRSGDGLPNLFTRARDKGYRTYLVGWYHPYHIFLGPSVDFIRSAGFFNELGDGPVPMARYFLWDSTIQLLGNPTASRLVGSFDQLRNRAVVGQNENLLAYTRSVLDDPRPGQFGVFHLPLPHWPFCYCATGVKSLDAVYPDNSIELAHDQLAYFDRVIGELLDQLKSRGKLERSTIILTSDHNWRMDPEMKQRTAAELSHVPLFIRLPGQTAGAAVQAPFSTVCLEQLLDAVRTGDLKPADLDAAIRKQPWFFPLGDDEVALEQPLEK